MSMDNSWDTLSVSVLSQIVKNCPETFYEPENFAYLAMELCLAYLYKLFQSTNVISLDKSWEDLMSSIFVTAKTLVNCFPPKKQLVSVALAFLLIGYKGIREVSTNFCFSKVDEYFKCTSLLLKRFIDDVCSVSDDSILQMRKILGTCLNVITNLTKDCIKCIHVLEKKRSDLLTLMQTKLAFSLEQTISFAKLGYEMDYLGENTEGGSIYYTMFKYCTRCVQTVLTDSSIQVQEIGLQVLKNFVQKGTNAEDHTFLMLFVGELTSDFFLIIQNMLQGFIRASVAQEYNATKIKPITPFLEIKLPVPTEASKEKQPPSSATTKQSPVSDHQREEEEEEEDWDAFQSFPATTNAAENDSRVESSLATPNLVEKSSLSEVDTENDQFHGDSISQPPNNVEVTSKADHQEAGGAEVISGSPDDLTSSQGNLPCENVETEEPHEFQTNSGVIEACHDRRERDDEVMSRPEDRTGAGLNQVTEQIPSELHLVKDFQGLVGMNSGHH